MGKLIEKWFGFSQIREELEARIGELEDEKTELEREIARLKSLEGMEEKSDLDLQNWRFKSAIEDLKRQNRKLEEENIALKERAYGLKEQP
ncbi:chaperone protein dnaK [Helicobacter pylori]|nr:chaperone protein dnaK [Helicobacter pylori]MDU9765723.1 chaperone protein dnaK [Helicobacter pylori]